MIPALVVILTFVLCAWVFTFKVAVLAALIAVLVIIALHGVPERT